ncbi:MAG: inositol monophosphatase family protein [Nitrososphaerota archaeon]|nr:fructose 1,6-bisphosphatase [Candidatus Bathyarchaeota archaeon]MDW8194541.1 inositol monophosphatase family protein [Nitrososphaerota archaeon]
MDWASLLVECKENVRRQITPLLKGVSSKGPNLGVGAGGDPIKQADLAAEKAIIDTLTSHDVSFILISEESGIRQYGENPKRNYVTVDPIDGTTNLTRGIPFYATSIAVSSKPTMNSVHTALVADLFHETTYTAEKGKGAHRNGERIFPSNETSLEDAVIGLDLNTYKVNEIAPKVTKLIGQTKHIRHLGANALELCYVADGTTDAFIDIRGKLRATDTAAAWLIIKEAGGKITHPDGTQLNSKLDPKERVNFVASGNAKLHKTILNLIRA